MVLTGDKCRFYNDTLSQNFVLGILFKLLNVSTLYYSKVEKDIKGHVFKNMKTFIL